MKKMSDRKMDMSPGQPKSEGFFPENAHNRALPRAGEIRGFDYPDKESQIVSDQNDSIRKTNSTLPKPDFRH